jgi:hypothetical protein
MSDLTLSEVETAAMSAVASMQDRLRAMHVTLLFIAILLCVMLGLNLILIAGD